jgi:type II secretory pathway pseudopilin PulG
MATRRNAGFSVIEAIVLIAIVGVFAAVAAPNAIRMQARSRTAEALTNLARLRDAQHAAYAEHGAFVRAGAAPAGVPGERARAWVGADALEFREFLGFAPEGGVFFQYGANGAGDAFTLTAVGDLDGRGARAQFALVHPAPGSALGLPHEIGTCSRRGVWDERTQGATRLDAIGPCGAQDGRGSL